MHCLIAIAAATGATAPLPAQPIPQTEVMVLGTYHFDNPGRDVVNVEVDDVLKPRRQAELRALARALAEFKPTKVMVERETKANTLVDPDFAGFTPVELGRNRDERTQIGYRIAYELKLSVVHAIDERGSAGEPDYFPFEKVAEYDAKKGSGTLSQRFKARGAEWMAKFAEDQKRLSIPAMLTLANDPEFQGGNDAYYEMLNIGDSQDQPGAELNAYWYMRNAKIFAKLMMVAKPGDRILVVYGSGHNYWLRHFANEMPGYVSVDPVPYLKKANAAQR